MLKTIMIVLLVVSSQAYAQRSAPEQIREAISALPEALRSEATVVGYSSNGERVMLRKGTNGITCWADDPNPNLDEPFYVLCFPKTLEQFLVRNRELKESGVANRTDVLKSEIESGKLTLPSFEIRYTLRGQKFEEALPLTIIHVPYATSNGTGFSSETDHYRPWLMMEGTPFAHIMIPGH
jgi:hypothetical protein